MGHRTLQGSFHTVSLSPDDREAQALLTAHTALIRQVDRDETCHVMTAEQLRAEGVALFGLRDDAGLRAIAGLRQIGPSHGEIKSMHTAVGYRGRGLARRLLRHVMDEARRQGLERLSLETGTAPDFAAARAVYHAEGFAACLPFGTYRAHPLSLFMTRIL